MTIAVCRSSDLLALNIFLGSYVVLSQIIFQYCILIFSLLNQGHGHWVNTLALSTEYVLRTGAFDHTGKQYNSAEEMKQVTV